MAKLNRVVVLVVLSVSPVMAAEIPDIVMDSKVESMRKAGLGPVVFPHKLHEDLYTCADCHPKIFVEKKGANNVDMEKNITEQHCGAPGCHNSAKAFPLYLCENCHTELKAPVAK